MSCFYDSLLLPLESEGSLGARGESCAALTAPRSVRVSRGPCSPPPLLLPLSHSRGLLLLSHTWCMLLGSVSEIRVSVCWAVFCDSLCLYAAMHSDSIINNSQSFQFPSGHLTKDNIFGMWGCVRWECFWNIYFLLFLFFLVCIKIK